MGDSGALAPRLDSLGIVYNQPRVIHGLLFMIFEGDQGGGAEILWRRV